MSEWRKWAPAKPGPAPPYVGQQHTDFFFQRQPTTKPKRTLTQVLSPEQQSSCFFTAAPLAAMSSCAGAGRE